MTRSTFRLMLATTLVAAGISLDASAQQFKMPKVELDFDAGADFSRFKTYAWKDTGVIAADPGMHARIIWYVDRALENKGLRKSKDATGDLLVRYYAKKKEGIQGTPSQEETYLPGGAGQLTTSVDLHKVVGGTLLLEMQRASDAKAVWRAATEIPSLDKDRVDAETKSAVRLLIAKYPPPKP